MKTNRGGVVPGMTFSIWKNYYCVRGYSFAHFERLINNSTSRRRKHFAYEKISLGNDKYVRLIFLFKRRKLHSRNVVNSDIHILVHKEGAAAQQRESCGSTRYKENVFFFVFIPEALENPRGILKSEARSRSLCKQTGLLFSVIT